MKKKCLLLFSSVLVGTSLLSIAIAEEKGSNASQFVIEIEANRYKAENRDWDKNRLGTASGAPDMYGKIRFLGREYNLPVHKNTYLVKRAFFMADLEQGTRIHIQFYDRDRLSRSDDVIATGTVVYQGRPTVSVIEGATIRLQYYPPKASGGGGSSNEDNQTVVITPDNAKQIAREVYSAQAILSGAGGQSRGSSKWICKMPTKLQELIGAADLTVWLFQNLRDNAKKLYKSGSLIERLKRVGKLECDNAAQGGLFETSLDFAKKNGWKDVSATVNFKNCRVKVLNGVATAEGDMGLTFKKDKGTYRLETGFNGTRLILPNGHHFYSIEGGYSIALDLRKTTIGVILKGTKLAIDFGDSQCQYGGEKDNGQRFKDFTMTLDLNIVENYYACSYEGVLFSVPLAGSVRYKTTAAFKGNSSDYPYTGTMEIFGKNSWTGNQPKLTLRAEGARVSLGVDMDGNNSPEIIKVYSWDDFLNKL